MDVALLTARLALACVFVVAGIAKLVDLPGSRKAIVGFGIPARFAPLAGTVLPVAELIVGALLLPAATARWGAVGALALLALFIGAIGMNLARGRTPDCHCFGQLHSAPAGRPVLARNGLLSVVALFIVVAGWTDPGPGAVGWLTDPSAGQSVLLGGGILAVAFLALLTWAVANLMAQHGRLLARLETVEQTLAVAGRMPAITQNTPVELSPGTSAPAFNLPDLDGAIVTLDGLRAAGSSILLVFTDPGCGPCNALMPDIARWQASLTNQVRVVLISRGSREANMIKAQQYELGPVLLDQEGAVSWIYGVRGTPAAVLIRPDGTIEAPPANGAAAILRTIGAITESEVTVPAMAPEFQLPDLDGEGVTLSNLRAAGKPVLLVFTDYRCSSCDELLPDIADWQQEYDNQVTIAVIGTGEVAVNREKVRPYGVARVLVQQELEVVNAFGLSQAPALVVVQPDGRFYGSVVYGDVAIRSQVAEVVNTPQPRVVPMANRDT